LPSVGLQPCSPAAEPVPDTRGDRRRCL